MILLDTHIWVWWVQGDPRLGAGRLRHIKASEADGLGVSAISCWEVAKLVELGRLILNMSLLDWIRGGLAYPGVQLVNLTPEIAVESTTLPGTFHKDPADQILVATARILDCPIVTLDSKIQAYPHVRKV